MNTRDIDRAWTPVAVGLAGSAIFAAMWLGRWDFGIVRSWVAFLAIAPLLLITGIVAHHMVQGEIKAQEIGDRTPGERKTILRLSRVMIALSIIALVLGVLAFLVVLAIFASLDEDDSLLFIQLMSLR